jgi:GH25 family lysozyme M1 (1,4-beta-N-acetylmuramidase)
VLLSRLARVVGVALAGAVVFASAAAADVTGPDVSSWQHPSGAAVDWSAVHAAGHDFSFVKATEGGNYTNAYFGRDWSAVSAAGLYRGAYHYARPSSSAGSAAAQARYFAAVIGDQTQPMTLPPTLDLEESGGLSPAALVAWTSSFLTTLQSLTDRTPILYTYPYFWRNQMGGSTAFTSYPLWIASYGTSAPPTLGWPQWTFWQYSSTSTVRGIPGAGAIDVSRFNGDMSALAALALSTSTAGGTPSGVTDPAPAAVVEMSSPSRYVPITPARFVDTRLGVGAGKGPVTGPVTVQVPDAIPADATGVVLNASVVDPSGAGYLRTAAAGTTPLATALNYSGGQSSTGLVVTPIDATRKATVTLYGGAGQVVLDAVGYYTSATGTGGHYVALAPSRIADSRTGVGVSAGPQSGDVTVPLPDSVPADVAGVVLNVSVVEPTRSGFLRVAPAGTTATTTALNYPAARSATGLVLTGTANRSVTVSLHGGPAQLVVDLVGYYDQGSSSGSAFVSSTPQRVLDTRSGLGGASGRSVQSVTLTLPSSVPADATGAVLNLSAVSPDGKGYLRLAAAGAQPTTTAISFDRARSVTGLALTPIGAGRQITVTVYGAGVDVVADLVGFHTAG